MAKKDFSQINTNRVFSTITEATAEQSQRKERKTYTKEEAAAYMQNFKTSGHKGVKMPRINIAFTPEIHDYIQTMAKVTGMTMTDFVNIVLKQYKDEHMEQYEKAVEFRNSL